MVHHKSEERESSSQTCKMQKEFAKRNGLTLGLMYSQLLTNMFVRNFDLSRRILVWAVWNLAQFINRVLSSFLNIVNNIKLCHNAPILYCISTTLATCKRKYRNFETLLLALRSSMAYILTDRKVFSSSSRTIDTITTHFTLLFFNSLLSSLWPSHLAGGEGGGGGEVTPWAVCSVKPCPFSSQIVAMSPPINNAI